MSVFDGFGADAWAQYHKQLVHSISGTEGDGRIVQPLAAAQRVEWDAYHPDRNFWHKQDLVNAIPHWGPLYKRTTTYLPDAYRSFLGALNDSKIEETCGPNRDKLRMLEAKRKSVQAQIDLLTAASNRAWQTYVHDNPEESIKARPQWEEDLGYAAHLHSKRTEVHGIEGAMLLLAVQSGGDLQDSVGALSALGAPNAQIALPFTDSIAGLGRDFWQSYYITTLDGDISNFRAETRPQTMVLDDTAPKTPCFESRWNSNVDMGWCSFLDSHGGIADVMHADWFKMALRGLSITFDNLAAFNIMRPGWFKQELIRDNVNRVDPELFTVAGELPLIPVQILVAYGLRLDVEVDEYSRDFFYDRHQRGIGGFSIGPFSFGVEGSTSTYVEARVTKTETGLCIEDTSCRPFVVGVVSERPYDLLAYKPMPLWVEVARELGGVDRAYTIVEMIHSQVAGDRNLRRIAAGAL